MVCYRKVGLQPHGLPITGDGIVQQSLGTKRSAKVTMVASFFGLEANRFFETEHSLVQVPQHKKGFTKIRVVASYFGFDANRFLETDNSLIQSPRASSESIRPSRVQSVSG